jgi:hypothetical protein
MTVGKYYDMKDVETVVDALIRMPGAGDVPWSNNPGTAGTTSTAGRAPELKAYDMTLRDHFAGMALQGMLANNPLTVNATVAYLKADEMMKARQR